MSHLKFRGLIALFLRSHKRTHKNNVIVVLCLAIAVVVLASCGSVATGQCDPFTRNCGNTGDAWQSNLTTDALMLGEIPNLCAGHR